MTTKEDYEFAALAAGVKLAWIEGVPRNATGFLPQMNALAAPEWNPRFGGNDSQDLMVRVGITVYSGGLASKNTSTKEVISCIDCDFTPGDAQSMREAIFRVAVQVGRAMP